MARLDEVDLARKDLIDLARSAVGIWQRREKRRILNVLEPELLSDFEKRVARGQSFRVTPAEIFKRLSDGM